MPWIKNSLQKLAKTATAATAGTAARQHGTITATLIQQARQPRQVMQTYGSHGRNYSSPIITNRDIQAFGISSLSLATRFNSAQKSTAVTQFSFLYSAVRLLGAFKFTIV